MKPWYASKSLWIAVLAALLAGGTMAQDYLQTHPGQWGAAEWLGLVVLLLGGLLAQLRLSGADPIPGTPAAAKAQAAQAAAYDHAIQVLDAQTGGVRFGGPATVQGPVAGRDVVQRRE